MQCDGLHRRTVPRPEAEGQSWEKPLLINNCFETQFTLMAGCLDVPRCLEENCFPLVSSGAEAPRIVRLIRFVPRARPLSSRNTSSHLCELGHETKGGSCEIVSCDP